MTNQTIDGVPRELLERLLNAAEWQKLDFYRSDLPFKAEIASTVSELRALLDAPSKKFSAEGWSIDHSAGRPILVHNNCSVIEAEQAYGLLELIKSAAQPQGEPVAWQYRVSAGPQTGWSLWHDGKGEEFKQSYQVETRPLYAEQPAPVAVVLPERPNGGL